VAIVYSICLLETGREYQRTSSKIQLNLRKFMMATILLGGISQSLQDATAAFAPTINQVNEASQKAKQALTITGGRAVNAIANRKDQVVDTFTQTTEKAKAVWRETANQAVDTITTNTEQAKAYAADSLKKASDVSDMASASLQKVITSLIGDWINTHPKFFWLVSHPFLSLGLLFLAILIILGLLKALSQFFEKAWLIIFQAPVKLIQVIVSIISRPISGLLNRKKFVDQQKFLNEPMALTMLNFQSTNLAQKERLTQIFSRLEAINQEQNKLMKEVVAILNSDKLA
jgi:hypothetical protein